MSPEKHDPAERDALAPSARGAPRGAQPRHAQESRVTHGGSGRTPVVAVVDDDTDLRETLQILLSDEGYRTFTFGSAEETLAWSRLSECDAVLCDVRMPGMGGENLLAELKRRWQDLPVLMITGHGDVSLAVRCLKAGAYDLLQKPFDPAVLIASVARAVERSRLREEHARLRRLLDSAPETIEGGRYGMVGTSPAMRALYQQIEVVAPSDASVLIHGETGSGKELVARAIHRQGRRASGPFVAINAGALPESLLESELFGHSRGAYTGAVEARDGKLVAASRGTLMLDEVETLSAKAQVQLLRVLEDGLVIPLGRDQPRQVDIRLLVASKEDLSERVRKGQLRSDFFHRVVVLVVEVPPLRARREDIPLLVSHFIRRAAERAGSEVPSVPEPTLAAMLRHHWPGNVRELQNAVERMFVTARNGEAGPFRPMTESSQRLLSITAASGRLREALERTEREVIEATLRAQHGQISAAARSLGISRRALYQRLERYGLSVADWRNPGDDTLD